MGARTGVTGATWNQATGTTATAGTTGLNVCTGFTHVLAADLPVALPPGVSGTALGAIKTAANVAGTFRITAAGHAGAASTKYGTRFWLMARRTDKTLTGATGGSAGAQAMLAYNGTGANKNTFYVTPIIDSTDPTNHSGLCFTMRNTNSGAWFGAHGCSDSGAFLWYNFQFERWARLGLWIHTGAAATADGQFGLTINGQLVSKQTGITTDSITVTDDTITLPAIPGVEFYVVFPQGYDGTGDAELTQAPDANSGQFLTPSGFDVTHYWPYLYSDGATATLAKDEGANWYTSAGNQPTEAAYSAYSGVDGGRARAVWTDKAGTTQESTRKIGTLQYNAEGWDTLYFPDALDVYGSVTTLTHTLTIYQTDNVSVILKLMWDDKFIYQTSVSTATRICPRPPGRMALAVKFNSDGRLQVGVQRLSDASAGTAIYDVYPMVIPVLLANWVPTSLGKVTYVYSGGGTGASSQTVEWGGMAQFRYLTLPGFDSFTQVNHGGSGTPATAGSELSTAQYSVGFGLGFLGLRQCEGAMLPGSFIPDSGGPVYCFAHPVGWSGKTVIRAAAANGRALTALSGDRIVWCSNAANTVGSVTTAALAQSVGSAWARAVASVVIPGAENESRHDIILPWTGQTGGSYTGNAHADAFVLKCRAEVARLLTLVDTHERVTIINTKPGYTEGSAPHLSAAGYTQLAGDTRTNRNVVKFAGLGGRIGQLIR